MDDDNKGAVVLEQIPEDLTITREFARALYDPESPSELRILIAAVRSLETRLHELEAKLP
jgi:hypothetical protein